MDTLLRQLDELPVGVGEGPLFSGRAEPRPSRRH
jgi:hypothetical protein